MNTSMKDFLEQADPKNNITPVSSEDVSKVSDELKAIKQTLQGNSDLEKLSGAISSITKIEGKKGDAGYTPVKGKDYRDGIDGIDGRTPMTVSSVKPKNPKLGDLWYKI